MTLGTVVQYGCPIGSISAVFSGAVCDPPESLRGVSAGSFPEQRLVIEPRCSMIWCPSLFYQPVGPRNEKYRVTVITLAIQDQG